MWVQLTTKDGDVEHVNLDAAVLIEREPLVDDEAATKYTWITTLDNECRGPYIEAPETFLNGNPQAL